MLSIKNQRNNSLTKQEGVALLLVLVVVAVLSVLTIQLAASVNLQMQASGMQKRSALLDSAILGSVNLVRSSLYADQKNNNFDSLHDSWNNLIWPDVAAMLEVDKLDVKVEDLSGKIPVNRLVYRGQSRAQANKQRKLWVDFLLSGSFAVADRAEAEALVDSLSDWLDEDDNPRPYGAESGYYTYPCRNGPIYSIDELLLIKGFSKDLLYGNQQKRGIAEFLTIYGTADKININTADLLVLQALDPNADKADLQLLLDFRADKDNQAALANGNWYRNVPGLLGPVNFTSGLTTVKSSEFKVVVKGELDGFKRRGEAIIFRAASKKQKLISWKQQ